MWRLGLAGWLVVWLMAGLYCGPAEAQSGVTFSYLSDQVEPRKRAARPRAPARTRQPARPRPGPDAARPSQTEASPPAPVEEASPATGSALWRILRTSWSESDEKGFAEFVARIGESKCRSMHACLTSAEANPLYRASNPQGAFFYADCADLPYMLRAYYAWKNNLPFSYASAVSPLGRSRDIRYTAAGNEVAARRDLLEGGIDAPRAIRRIVDTITSANYRYPPDYKGALLPDHYPVAITRDSIKPGTILYDPNGHVAVVYKVTPEGRIHYMDTHPDNSLTRGIYGKAFTRASPAMGAGFKRWRPQTLEGASEAADGTLTGGRITLAADKDLADWSDEQFHGTETPRPKSWNSARFAIDGEALPYYDFVRRRLADAGFRYDPVDETRTRVRTLCQDLQDRVEAVDIALKAGLAARPQPDRLPGNIYGTDGDWETYATPSRDARLKTSFAELREEIARFLTLRQSAPDTLAYEGADLRADLLKAYRDEASLCSIRYKRSDGAEQELSFRDVAARLFRLSFDPYHCAERRWGAERPEELAACRDGAQKTAWYEAEQRLRNQPDRTYDARMGFTLGDLKRAVADSGIDEPPDIDVLRLLEDSTSLAVGTEKTGSGTPR